MSTPQHLFKQLSTDRQQNADVLEKQSMRGVKLRVIEKYSDSAHFIYELLQNADDVKATRARFVLTESGILFAHNGTIHFSVTAHDNEEIDTQNQRLGHINAITSIGNSNKYEAQIGKFGVGFKAVFQYSSTPEIYDPPFFFKIERFIVPILLSSDHPDRQPDETLFYFPFDNPLQSPALAFQVILKKLKNLINPLLFLRFLIEINWITSDGNQGKYIKHEKPTYVGWVKSFSCPPTSEKLSYVGWVKSFSCPPTSLENFLIFTNQTNAHFISIAYLAHLSEKGEPISISYQQTFPAYCFFPTKETTHLHFIVQAPFLLTDNREGIKQGEAWNRHLIEALAQLTADSLPIIKEIGLLTDDFFNVLPINAADFPAEHLFRPIYEVVLKRLQSDNALLPNQAGGYTPHKKSYLAENPALMHLLTSEQLSVLVKNEGAQWVFSQTTHHQRLLWDYVRHHLVNQELTSDKLVRRLTKAFIQVQSDEWLIQFYTYLLEKARYLWKYKHNTLQAKPLLRLANNEIVSPYNRVGKIQVYLPTENESEYPTVKRCFIENEKSLQFLLALGLDKPKAFEEITYYILPRYKKKIDIAPSVMLRDFKKLFSYFLNCPWHQKENYLNQLKNIPYACHLADNSSARLLPSAIYFNTESLKNFFRHTPNIYFLDNAFYANIAKEKTQFIHFFKALGVEDKPRRIKMKAVLSGQEREAIHQGKYTYDYYHSSQYTYDYDIEGLDAFLTEMNLERSKILWHFLLKLIEENLGQEIFKGQYNWFYRRERYHYFDARFLITLRQTAWLYNHNSCLKPADIIAPELAANYDTESYAAKILIEKLGVQQERFTNFSEAQKDSLIYGNEFFKLAKATGKAPAEVLKNFKHFLAQRKENSRSHAPAWECSHDAPASRSSSQKERKNENYPFTPDAGASILHSHAGAWEREEDSTSKRVQLEEQFKQKFDELTKIEELRTRLNQIEKYTFHWFNTLLELEYLLYGENKKNGFNIKFSKVEKIPQSATRFILKNPSRYIPPSIEDIADLSLQLYFGSETKTVLIEAVNVKEFTLHARLKSATDIQEMDINRVQSAVVEIKNPAFVLDKLKTAFQQLPCADDDNLQANLTPQIEFILGPPGTGKTTYLAKERIIPFMQGAGHLKILVLTPTNKVADVLVNKIMRFAEPKTAQNALIRFGVTGNSEIEKAGLLKEKSFDLTHLKKCVLVTTIARFLYDGFSSGLLKDFHWDIIVFDEASMIMLAQMVHVLYQQTHCRFIIGGDPFQIQPLVLAEQWKAENIYTLVGINRFQSIKTVPHHFPITQLTTQYRSIPPLGMLFSQFSYDGILKHHRQITDKKPLKLAGFELKEITVIKFPVNQENIYRARRLESGGIYHIYSAILTVEIALSLSKHQHHKIGIVCPYLAQATLVEKMLAVVNPHPHISIITGTVHRFQGDEFDIILNLLNPPPLISSNIFLNNQNILNVAISRARDYLILLIPVVDGLGQIKRLETLLKNKITQHYQELTSGSVEKILFKQSNYIDKNTSISTHQNINVYGKPKKKYEVLLSSRAVDVRLLVHDD